jgi:hypothetical protein
MLKHAGWRELEYWCACGNWLEVREVERSKNLGLRFAEQPSGFNAGPAITRVTHTPGFSANQMRELRLYYDENRITLVR